MVRLGEILMRRVEPIDKVSRSLESLNVIAKIAFSGVLHLRDDEAKRTYKGPLFEARAGDLVISKIRVGQGSFCIIDQAFDHVAVSPEYPIYKLDPKRVDESYLALSLRMPSFMGRLAGSGNTTKRRITPAYLESLAIPLPPLAEQQAAVAAHAAALARAAEDEAEAARLEAEARHAFAEALGLEAPALPADRPILIARFRDLDRWSHDIALRGSGGGAAATARWPVVALGDVIADLENGWSPKCLDRSAEEDEWGVLKLGAVSFGTFEERQNKALPTSLTPKPRLEIETGQVLISRANITRLVGATAYVGSTRPRLLLCDKIFRCVFNRASTVDPVFVAEILRTKPLREQIEAKVTGTSPTMKNISKPALLALTFPLPPLSTQRELVAALTTARAQAAELRASAAEAHEQARAAFETSVYG